MPVPRHTTLRWPALVLAAILAAAAAPGAEVGVADGPKGVVVNTRNGKAYAAFPDLGAVKILKGANLGHRPGHRRHRQHAQGTIGNTRAVWEFA